MIFFIVLTICLFSAAIAGIVLAYMSFKKSLEKNKRVVDEQYIQSVEWQRCVACGKQGPNDAHHVTTRGAGGGDTWDNLMPLCRVCHSEWHQIGPSKMIKKYDKIYQWLKEKQREDVLEKVKL